MGEGKHSIILKLGLTLLVSFCTWAMSFTSAFQLFSLPLAETGRFDRVEVRYLASPTSNTKGLDLGMSFPVNCLCFSKIASLVAGPLQQRTECF